MKTKRLDRIKLIGKKFGQRIVIAISKVKKYYFDVKCVCGKISTVRHHDLLKTSHCGCLNKRCYKHGKHGTKIYRTWQGIKSRCKDKNNQNYGGRGIKVCKGFHNSFSHFYSIIGDPPSPKHSIDRIKNNLHYSCGICPECRKRNWKLNCKWATQSEQSNNTRSNRIVTVGKEKLTTQQFANKIGIRSDTFRKRLDKYKWSIDKATTTPALKTKKSVVYKGKIEFIKELSEKSGLKYATLWRRLYILHWPVEKAVDMPVVY